MRLTIVAVLAALPLACAVHAPPPRPPPAQTIYFYSELDPYGDWFVVAGHGWVWRPHGTAVGWRPYTEGHWVYTVEGWTWVSYWSWGWVPFHHGRWLFDPAWGWVWVPGNVWAPAWVAWRYGDGWVGWAPLPPGAYWRPGAGLYHPRGDLHVYVSVTSWCFVPTGEVFAQRVGHVAVPATRNHEILPATRTATRYEASGSRVISRGVPVSYVETQTGRAVRARPVVDSDRAPQGRPAGRPEDPVRVYRPPARPVAPPPARAAPAGRPERPLPTPQKAEPRPVERAPTRAGRPLPTPAPDRVPERPRALPAPTPADRGRADKDEKEETKDEEKEKARPKKKPQTKDREEALPGRGRPAGPQ